MAFKGKIVNRLPLVAGEKRMLPKDIAKIGEMYSSTVIRQWMAESNGISYDTLARICYALDCQPGDILQFVPENNNGS